MKKTIFNVAALFLCVTFILASCLEEIDRIDKIEDPSFAPSFDFPLVSSDFSMEEFITEGESKAKITEQQGLMVLTYDDTVTTPAGDSFFSLPNQQSPTVSITGPEVSFPAPGATITVTKNLTFAFSPANSEALDSVLIKAGQMLFQMNSTFPADISLNIRIASLKIQGSVFQRNFTFTGAGNQSPSFNLQNSSFDLTANGTTTNTISVSVTATITDTGQPINNTHRLDCSFSLNNLAFRGIFGDLSSSSFQLAADSLNVDIFNNALGTSAGNIELLEPAIRLTTQNSFGIPLGFDIQNIVVTRGNSSIALSGPAASAPANPYRLNAPSYSQVGQTVTSEININSGNSNLSQLISSLPQYMAYQFDLGLNPPPVTSKNFVLDDSKLVVGVHLELPFHGRVSALSISKRFDFSGLGIADIEQSRIKVKTVNESPLDAYVQIYFVDNSGQVLDSLFTDRSFLKGAPIGTDGFTVGAAEVVKEITVTQAKINRIDQAEFLVMAAVMYTSNNGTVPVKFSSTDKLKVTVGINTRVQY
jgi:hypothetical protein